MIFSVHAVLTFPLPSFGKINYSKIAGSEMYGPYTTMTIYSTGRKAIMKSPWTANSNISRFCTKKKRDNIMKISLSQNN